MKSTRFILGLAILIIAGTAFGEVIIQSETTDWRWAMDETNDKTNVWTPWLPEGNDTALMVSTSVGQDAPLAAYYITAGTLTAGWTYRLDVALISSAGDRDVKVYWAEGLNAADWTGWDWGAPNGYTVMPGTSTDPWVENTVKVLDDPIAAHLHFTPEAGKDYTLVISRHAIDVPYSDFLSFKEVAIPEPTTMTLIGLGGLMLVRRKSSK